MASCSYDIFSDLDSEEEFEGFRREDIVRAEGDIEADSGESDISVSEDEDSDSISEEGVSEVESEAASDTWTFDVSPIHILDFEEDVGPSTVLPADAKALDFFHLLFTEELVDLIVVETNRNAQQKQHNAGVVDKNWHPTTSNEIRAYIGLRFLQGIKCLPSERHYWSKHKFLGVSEFKKVLPRNRYLKINQYLHFNDSETAVPRGEANYDKLHKIRPFLTKLEERFVMEYFPNRENAIDEAMVKFKGRLGFKQYMPLKPTKRGIKVWMRADAITHYVSRFEVYTGRKQQGPEHGLGARVVRDLSADLKGQNYHLYFDNFFSSFGLMKSLLDDGIYATATTRQNRKEFPVELKKLKLKRGESKVMQREGINACVWEDKKTVSFLSTNSQPTGNDTVNRKQNDGTVEAIAAPPCVVVYNKFMGGVDYADQKRSEYRIPVKSRRWYRYLAFFLIDTAAVNAFILRQLSPNHPRIKHLNFRLELVEQLIGDYSSSQRKRSFNQLQQVDGQNHFPKQMRVNRCVYCASKGIRKRSTWGCLLCKVSLCVACFEPYHIGQCR